MKRKMIINYVPGDECRVAVTENGRLEEFYSERTEQTSHVGSIYVGRVTNVEASIQAAFVDFGLDQNGFLHISDLHPRYFPGEGGDATESVGRKTPRRERPPIQQCLKRGQEIAVQVLKEGVGSKGPTLTSYLSVPGRYLVMMPLMDRVGVSRKVEDEEVRRKMVEILDQLDLPEGFGFILRTAGLDRTKAELKRDLAYLLRLWKDMERRWKRGSRPRLLYSESDLLLRVLRDVLTSDTDELIVDHEAALKRSARFLKIVAPRSETTLLRYTGGAPVFHAVGIEEQIRTIYAREVPLPSGGRLVIDEAEAVVAIDVNSGKSREARDSETNAYETNLEAIEEISRQLKLRDLGGIVINDLIDMRASRHRRDVEAKFRDLLKKDRARTTLAPISEFGVLEMTRQRMRGSHESMHFHECPSCKGRGLVQRPDSVAADALRDLADLLDHDKVAKVEMVVHPRIAGELLSSRRKALGRLERASGKVVTVRLSDAVSMDRVTFYAYAADESDIEVDRLGKGRPLNEVLEEWREPDAAPGSEVDPESEQWTEDAPEPDEPEPEEVSAEVPLHPIEREDDGRDGGRGRGRRGGRRGRGRSMDRDGPRSAARGDERDDHPRRGPAQRPAGPSATRAGHPNDGDGTGVEEGDAGPSRDRTDEGGEPGDGGGRRRRRRRGRRGRGRGGDSSLPPHLPPSSPHPSSRDDGVAGEGSDDPFGHPRPEHTHEVHADRAEPDGARDDNGHTSQEHRDTRGRIGDGPDAAKGGPMDETMPSRTSGEEELSTDREELGEGGGRRRRRRRGRRGRGGRGRGGPEGHASESDAGDASPHAHERGNAAEGPGRGGRREDGSRGAQRPADPRRGASGGRSGTRGNAGGNGRGGSSGGDAAARTDREGPPGASGGPSGAAQPKPQPRVLYGFRRRLRPGERPAPGDRE